MVADYRAEEVPPLVTRLGPDFPPPALWGRCSARAGCREQEPIIKKLLSEFGTCQEPLECCPGLVALELSSDLFYLVCT